MSRVMAIDYGLKRTGLAVTDPLQIIATALDTVDSKEIWSYLKDYFDREEVDLVILGMPKNLDGNDTHGTQPVKAFKEEFQTKFPAIKVTLIDERFTSKIAFNTMLMDGSTKKNRREKGSIDKIAATIMLQDYLASR